MIENNDFILPQDIYARYFTTIRNVKFTPREIEIIAFLSSGRSGKKTASFFSISPKTVENHARNIMKKLECNSREDILDFIEKAGKSSLLKQYYLKLLIHAEFIKSLNALMQSKPEIKRDCTIIHWPVQNIENSLAHHLATHLKLAGVPTALTIRENPISYAELCQNTSSNQYLIYIIALLKLDELSDHESHILPNPKKNGLLLLSDTEAYKKLPKNLSNFDVIPLKKYKSYYDLVFDILAKLISESTVWKNIYERFKNCEDALYNSSEFSSSKTHNVPTNINRPLENLPKRILKNRRFLVLTALLLPILGGTAGYVAFKSYFGKNLTIPHQLTTAESSKGVIRSDLVVPIDSVLLNRPDLLHKMGDIFKKNADGIRTIALVGIGGSGKTTLARQFARLQRGPVAWEINAETPESLSFSFESLAYVLSKTEEEKKELKVIQDIKNSTEREEKIIQWVKTHLQIRQNWLIIFDNLERFTDIQKYFPSDPETWGAGQIIITTRDNHIQNNNQINEVIQVGELDSNQKLKLFFQIMVQSNSQSISESQRLKTKRFLEQIPSFPLDVVVAAYYLKTTDLPYDRYLDHLAKNNHDFENIQKIVLKEIGNYTKTRYSIIALSIQKLINNNKDFRDLLLLVSLLDSQNIPRELLKTYKDDIIVDSFIFHLKKYFLITSQASIDSLSTFSIHRSTQILSLVYLINTLGLEKDDSFIKPISEILIKFISTTIDIHDFQSMNLLVTHCETFLKHLTLLNDYIKGNIQGELGGLYFYLGRYKNSISNLEESLIKLNKTPHKNHMEVARSLRYLGNVHRDLGNYDKSKDLFEQSHSLYERYFPHEYSGIARSFTYLGLIHRNLGNYEKAKDFLEKSLVIYERHVADQKQKMLGIARALAYLGSVERILSEFDNAKKHLEKSLVLFKEYFPENHLKVGWILAYLGNFHRDVGNHQISREYLEQSYKIYMNHFSINHLKVAWVALLLGNLYHEIGDYKKSNQYLKQCLAVYEKEYGKGHIETAKVLRNLGQAHSPEGNIEPAVQLISSSLDIFNKNKHPERFITLECLANLYLKKSTQSINTGDKTQSEAFKKQAINCLNQALKIIEVHFPKGSIHSIRIQNKLKEIGV